MTRSWVRQRRHGSEMRETGVGGRQEKSMSLGKRKEALLVSAALGLGVYGAGSSGADLQVKAPPATPFVLDVHGFLDVTFANNRVTGGGLLLYPKRGYLSQVAMGLSLDVYKNSTGFINSFSIFGGIWNENWS